MLQLLSLLWSWPPWQRCHRFSTYFSVCRVFFYDFCCCSCLVGIMSHVLPICAQLFPLKVMNFIASTPVVPQSTMFSSLQAASTISPSRAPRQLWGYHFTISVRLIFPVRRISKSWMWMWNISFHNAVLLTKIFPSCGCLPFNVFSWSGAVLVLS